MHAVRVEPVRVRDRQRELELGVVVLRTVRHRARCSCGWSGSSWRKYRVALAEGRWHAG